MPQWDDDIYLGAAEPGGKIFGSASATQPLRGIGPMGRVYALDLGTPLTADAQAVCLAQAVGGAGFATINGTRSFLSQVYGKNVAFFAQNAKVGICPQMVSTNAGDTVQTVLLTGRDVYGQIMTQRKTLNGTTPVAFTKAFKYVDSVVVSAALAGNLSVGTRDAFGFPICVKTGAYVLKIGWGDVYGPDDAGTVTTADTTNPATSSTNDVRGFYVPSSAADGTKVWTVALLVGDEEVGSIATRRKAFGVTQA